MRVNAGQAKADLSKLLARLAHIARPVRPGDRFLAARGSLAGRIEIADDFEFANAEVDEILDEPVAW